MTLTFACGCRIVVSDGVSMPPRCETCHETRITRVECPPPRFRGVASGPHCQTERLDPIRVTLAPPLILKPPQEDHDA